MKALNISLNLLKTKALSKTTVIWLVILYICGILKTKIFVGIM